MALEVVGYVFNTIFLLSLVGVVFFFSIIFSIWFLLNYRAKEDKGFTVAVFPKIVFVLGFTLTLISIFLMPYSLFSRKLNMGSTWYQIESIFYQVLYFFILVVVIVVVPFAICFYENHDPYVKRSWVKQTICGLVTSGIITVVFILICIGTYFLLGYADTTIVSYVSSNPKNNIADAFVPAATQCTMCVNARNKMTTLVSFVIYMVAMSTLVGYALFVCFGGCGMTAYPVSLICGFIKRPKPMDTRTYLHMRHTIKMKAEKLLEVGEKIDSKIGMGRFNTPRDRLLFSEFRQTALQLCEDWRLVDTSHNKGGGSIILQIAKLILGIVSGVISILWILHIIFYVAIQPYFSFGFLNIVLAYSDYFTSGFPIIGTLLYAFFTIHLIMAVFSGSYDVAARIPLIAVYPLVKGDTMMSSLLVNVEIFMLTGISINQFTAYMFSDFASNSVLNLMFGSSIQNLRWFNYFYDYGVRYGFLIMCAVGFVYVIVMSLIPKKKNKEETQLKRLVRGITKTYYNWNIFKKKGKDDELSQGLLSQSGDK